MPQRVTVGLARVAKQESVNVLVSDGMAYGIATVKLAAVLNATQDVPRKTHSRMWRY
jgi:hypothetical protein